MKYPKGFQVATHSLFSGFGSLSSLSQRIQVAYAFGWLSQDILMELNQIRNIRNDIAHKWDITYLKQNLDLLIRDKQYPIEKDLADGYNLPADLDEQLSYMEKFRTRLIWIIGRVFYESACWVPVLKHRLAPAEVLYGDTPPELLRQVARICVQSTRKVIESK
ncbi:MAG: hypothetical protein U5P41_01905 [Gammaproteobacteria bacterium]|nr:hypothetical protein [Gammaproteobacteria bacterium]